jgi:hypothetical protein
MMRLLSPDPPSSDYLTISVDKTVLVVFKLVPVMVFNLSSSNLFRYLLNNWKLVIIKLSAPVNPLDAASWFLKYNFPLAGTLV